MKRTSFVMQSLLALRALAVIIVMLTATTAWADDLPAKDAIIVNLAPLKFVYNDATVTDEEENQDLWSKLMKYKFWGTGEVVFDKAGVVIKEPSGYTGTAGQKISLDATHTTSGTIVFNGSHTLGGPICEDDKDLSVPALDVSGISWEPAVNLISENAGEIQFIFVPPIDEEDMLNKHIWYDKYLEGITFGNNSGKTLYIMMPSARLNANRRKGRFTRIFLRDGITIRTSANDCKIRVVYVNDDATWNSTTKKWEGFDLSKSTIIDGEHYLGDLLFYTNADINWVTTSTNMKADLQGTFITSGSLTVDKQINITGQLIAGKSLLFSDEFDGSFQYVPFNPVQLRGDMIRDVSHDDDGGYEFDIYMNDDALTEVSFDYSLDFISKDDPKLGSYNIISRDDMGANPTDETDPHYMPFAQDGKTKHVVIPQGKHHLDKTIYLNVKPKVFNYEAFMLLRITNLHGAVMVGAIQDGAFLLKVTPPNKPPYFVDTDKIKLAVPEKTVKEKAGTIQAKDEEGDIYTFDITGGTAEDLFEIFQTGVVAMKNGVEPFDYEEWKEAGTDYTIVVDLCDRSATSYNTELCSQAKFTVSVIDQNEAPYFTNQSDVILFADGAAVSTDAITFADPDKFATGEFLNNELVIMGDESNLFEITADGYIKPKDGAVIDKSEYEIEVRVRDANKDKEGNLIYPDLYHDKTFTLRYYTTGVDYMDWDDSQKKLVSKNTATDTNAANDKVWLLGGTEQELGTYNSETWYVVPSDGVNYSSPLFLKGDVHVILTDGAMMKHQIETLRQSEILTIHGQTEGTGKLTGDRLVINGDITINGGIIEINSERVAISSFGNIFINGGQVTAAGRDYGIQIESLLNSANRYIILRWSKISDFIQASSYYFQQSGSVMKIPAGKCFLVDGTTTVFGSATADYVFTDEELTAIAGKKLIPALPIATGGVDYLAFTNDIGNWTLLGDEAQVYAVTGYNLTAGLVYLKPIEVNVVPKGMPVVIGNKNEGTALPANIYLVGPDAQAKTVDGLLKGFVACDGSKTVQDYLDESFGEGVSASDYIPYLLKGGTFKAVLVNADDVIKQDICLLFIPKWDVLTGKSVGCTNATRSIGIGEGGETTRIRPPLTPPTQEGKGCAQWYDLQGRRIEKPTRKGLYIRNGVKVVIK